MDFVLLDTVLEVQTHSLLWNLEMDRLRANQFEGTTLTRTNWPDSTFHFSLVRSVVLTDESLCCSLFSYQSGEEDWEPANHTLSLEHCRWILANEKQESIATVSLKKKTFHFSRSSSFSFSQSVTLGLPSSIHVNLMSRCQCHCVLATTKTGFMAWRSSWGLVG